MLYHQRLRLISPNDQHKPENKGYAIEIDRMRDPQDNLPLSLPLNELPNCDLVHVRMRISKDRMKTLTYNFDISTNEGPIVVRHVFTCNSKKLQEEPSKLLSSIQIHVPLGRSTGDGSSSCAILLPRFGHTD